MSGSLRDQLIKAGLAPKKTAAAAPAKHKKKRKNNGRVKANADAAKKIADKTRIEAERVSAEKKTLEKKALKEKIKIIIEEHHVKDHKGDVVYNYIAGKRVRKVFVKEDVKVLLSAGDLAITRLNGVTYLVSDAIGREIIELNPSWAMVFVSDKTEEADEYSEYKVPDDVSW